MTFAIIAQELIRKFGNYVKLNLIWVIQVHYKCNDIEEQKRNRFNFPKFYRKVSGWLIYTHIKNCQFQSKQSATRSKKYKTLASELDSLLTSLPEWWWPDAEAEAEGLLESESSAGSSATGISSSRSLSLLVIAIAFEFEPDDFSSPMPLKFLRWGFSVFVFSISLFRMTIGGQRDLGNYI